MNFRRQRLTIRFSNHPEPTDKNILTEKKLLNSRQQRGFSIIEMVVAIVVSSIMAIGIIDYIGRSVEGISSSANRNQLASAGRMALNRLGMELRNSLPNSIRETTATAGGDQCLEFIPVRAATTYINPPFTGGGGTTFDVVDFVPSQHGVSGGFAVIFPNRQDEIYDGDNGASGTWPDFPFRGPIEEISSIIDSAAADQSTVTLVATHRFNRRSPNKRFYVVEEPVSYCVVGDKLYRYTNYGYYTTQVDEEESGTCVVASNDRCLPNYAAAPDKMLITDNIDNTGLMAFTVGTQTLTRNSLIAIVLNITSDGDSIMLNHDVLTRSVP